jgi:S1-C subfamily serine protease
MVKKVVTDIVKYGTVQRAYLGISYPQQELSEEQIKKLESDYKIKIGDVQGIVVTDVVEGGAAKAAGIKVGDILTKINGAAVTSSPELQEQIAKYKPNDKITITLKRDNKDLTLNATLKAKLGNTDLASSSKAAEKLGGKLETIDKATAEKNDVEGGVIVKELGTGILGKSKVEKGFVITHVNDQPVKNTEEFYEALKKLTGGTVKLSGVYPGFFGNYAFMLNLNE